MSESTNAWDKVFSREGRVFLEPHEDMPTIVRLLHDMSCNTVLDLGCGTGRHVVHLTRQGFSVYGMDQSPEGIRATRKWLVDETIEADLRLHNMTATLPYQNAFFDAVISVQVIHHTDIAAIRGIVKEISRILKQDGLLFVTVPKLKNQGEKFEEIEPNTYIPKDGPEKGLPHHYFTPEELRQIFSGYEIESIRIDEGNHYCLTAYNRNATATQPGV